MNTILSGFNLSKINTNFTTLMDHLNSKVLYRDNPTGEPNTMQQDLDMNSKRILNLPVPLSGSEAARLQDVQDSIAGAKTALLTTFSPAGNIASTNVQTAIQELDTEAVHLTGTETITGAKTFSTSPVVPTLAVRDNSTKAASTQYVDALQNAGSRVMGLIGSNNTTTPLTKYDLSADAVVLRNSSGATVVRYVTGAITCDFGLAGSVANGRDQSAAFTANSWIHLYFIWNGTTLATLASTTTPASFTGSTLPSGYTHWAYATTVRWNGSSNLVAAYTRGASVLPKGRQIVLAGGSATTETAVSLTSVVPPNALKTFLNLFVDNGAGSGGVGLTVRVASGVDSDGFSVLTTYGSLSTSIPNINQNVYYILSVAAPSNIYVTGYTVPNGGE